jgi:pSer/pThr/pTyr-binding forkhead associated (FHA) protein
MKLTIVHLEGSKQGQTEYAPGPVISLGRDPSCQVAFDAHKDLDVSTRHASITFQGEQVMLQDLGSRNGTFLNGARVNGAVPLPQDSVVQFGEKGPKVKLSYVFHTGPGKKTQMIQDLSSKLDNAEASTAAAKKRNFLIFGCFFFLFIFAIAGWFIYGIFKKKAEDRDAVAALKLEVPKSKELAQTVGADTAAKAEWDAALEALAAAETAEKAEDFGAARASYEKAQAGFGKANTAATMALLAKYKGEAESAKEMAGQAEKNRAAQEAREAEDRKKREEEEKKRLAEIMKSLQDQQTLLKTLEELLSSTNVAAIKGGIEAGDKALAGSPTDAPLLKDKVAALKERLARLENMDELLKKAATSAKQATLAVRTHVYAIPGGQRPDTTKIRIPVAEGEGTGFFVAEGKVATAKEVWEPHLFQPAAAALWVKLQEKGMKLFTDVELSTYKAGEGSTAGVYTTTHTSPAVGLARRFEDTLSAGQPVKIKYDNADVEVNVRLHRRDEGNLVILKVDGLTGNPVLPLADGDAAPDTPIVVIGQNTGVADLDLKPGQTGLFQYMGKVTAGGQRQEAAVPSYATWVGGPIINADGKVVGILVESGSEKSKAISASILKREM